MQTWLHAGTRRDRQQYDGQASVYPERAWHNTPVAQWQEVAAVLSKDVALAVPCFKDNCRQLRTAGRWERKLLLQATGSEIEI